VQGHAVTLHKKDANNQGSFSQKIILQSSNHILGRGTYNTKSKLKLSLAQILAPTERTTIRL